MQTGLEGKLAVVTGAANGIGEAISIQLAEEGARVMMLDRDREHLDALAARLTSRDLAASGFVVDLTARDEVKALFAGIAEESGPVDILINNVGQAPRERAQEFSVADPALWDFIMEISLMSALVCSQQVVTSMRERRYGKIVNMASEAAFTGGKRSPEYSAAKAGVIGFTRGLARQLAPYGVNVNAVGPGPIRTVAMDAFTEEQLDGIKAGVAMGRLGLPSEIADAVCFLASDRASYITGQTLLVNGGGVFH